MMGEPAFSRLEPSPGLDVTLRELFQMDELLNAPVE
jgi:hypothetical protein